MKTIVLLLNGQDPGVAGALCLTVIALDVAEFSDSLFGVKDLSWVKSGGWCSMVMDAHNRMICGYCFKHNLGVTRTQGLSYNEAALFVWSNIPIPKCSDFVDTAFLGVFSTVCRAMLGQMAGAKITEASYRLRARWCLHLSSAISSSFFSL